MKLFSKPTSITDENDAGLVMRSLGGDRDAFCAIVSRYQNLLCSIAYSSVGDFKYSEDIAQEAFVDAWKKLDTLSDPHKLKAWLCGILRFKVSRYRRKTAKQSATESGELSDTAPSSETALDDGLIAAQQQTLLWKVLAQMEPTYREPLVLFYREEQSVQRVAAQLELSEDTVKQRLSRGRKMLREAMQGMVEDALKNSKPGVAFTTGVLTMISTIAPPAKAAVWGAGAAKAGSFFKLASVLTVLAAASGFISSFFGLRTGLAQSRTANERKLVIKIVVGFIGTALIFTAAMLLLKQLAVTYPDHAALLTIMSQTVLLIFIISYFVLVQYMFESSKVLRARERLFYPDAFRREADKPGAKQREYKSKLTLCGVPLCHIQFDTPEHGEGPAFGWIAGGAYARGLLFAWGCVAIAPISVGVISVGIVTIGAIGFGLLSLGTVAIGLVAFGAAAIGFKAYSSLSSLGWDSALSGGFAIAKEAALGAPAYAEQANTELAAEITRLTFFTQHYHWLLALIAVLVIVPAAWHSHAVRQRLKRER
ncbi:RNA polymerase sigma factor [Alteromonas gilva]|uniref:RNA polymerase sigma factor n=1 Tax=Alteromonas gilva TaxID=2987522 RepID=A0ABT5L5W1_9ALTE|nr:sigma-70 family RNA polymerase sigma factor [Alteromonas gilva]MDC8832444.1 sigma-70 family RNA polymerase sigma factor [Alteromonas gilva]